MGVHYQNDNRKILFNLGVYDKNKINNAGILFFCSNPKKYFINAYVTCARYKGTAKVKIIDRLDVEGNLINQLEESIKFIQRNTKLEYDIKGLERKEIPEYPLEALREAVLNALMHRDYFERGANVQIDIFDDRITVTNIGGLLKPLTKEKIINLASCFQDVAFTHLIRITSFVILDSKFHFQSLLVGGGVSANLELRKRLRKLGKYTGINVLFPYSKKLTGDNAAMIGVAAYFKALRGEFIDVDKIDRKPSAKISD